MYVACVGTRKLFVIACCGGLKPAVSTRTTMPFSSATAQCHTQLVNALKFNNVHLYCIYCSQLIGRF